MHWLAAVDSGDMRQAQGTRILLVETDRTLDVLWRYIVETAQPGAALEWVATSEAAERLMRERDLSGRAFHLVIAEGELASRVNGVQFQKPIDPTECIETIRASLASAS